jgi:hypothetical protein
MDTTGSPLLGSVNQMLKGSSRGSCGEHRSAAGGLLRVGEVENEWGG